MNRAISAIVADDEQALREALRRRLAAVWPQLEIVGEAENGLQALELVAAHEVAVAFLDIRMPGMDGVAVARHLAGRCHVVFVTAYDEYAVQAFEAESVDYLLKPVTEERLARTVARLQQRLAQVEPPAALTALLRQLASGHPSYLRWIRAGLNDAVRLLAVDAVSCFVAADKYTSVYTGEGEFLIRKPLKELEAELDPDHFWRIHRKALVNVAHIEAIQRNEEGNLQLKLRSLPDTLPVSRSYQHRFRQM
ncbi:MAG TPA: LytTR family DNA-binding domain-containing protein [Gammaproteobacteria bacterium]